MRGAKGCVAVLKTFLLKTVTPSKRSRLLTRTYTFKVSDCKTLETFQTVEIEMAFKIFHLTELSVGGFAPCCECMCVFVLCAVSILLLRSLPLLRQSFLRHLFPQINFIVIHFANPLKHVTHKHTATHHAHIFQ